MYTKKVCILKSQILVPANHDNHQHFPKTCHQHQQIKGVLQPECLFLLALFHIKTYMYLTAHLSAYSGLAWLHFPIPSVAFYLHKKKIIIEVYFEIKNKSHSSYNWCHFASHWIAFYSAANSNTSGKNFAQ